MKRENIKQPASQGDSKAVVEQLRWRRLDRSRKSIYEKFHKQVNKGVLTRSPFNRWLQSSFKSMQSVITIIVRNSWVRSNISCVNTVIVTLPSHPIILEAVSPRESHECCISISNYWVLVYYSQTWCLEGTQDWIVTWGLLLFRTMKPHEE